MSEVRVRVVRKEDVNLVSTSRKPPYRIPAMTEIAGMESNGLAVMSTFSGCGGSCLGFRMEGFRTLWASEFIGSARETYLANFPEVQVDPRDIRQVDPLQVIEDLGLRPGEVDVLEGSPPCAAFSTAGRQEESWGKVVPYSETEQRTDDLFDHFVRFVRHVRPKIFVAENVSGIVRGVSKGFFKSILSSMQSCGYRVEARMLDAQWLGVPQRRRRVIFMGIRDDLPAAHRWPKPLPYRYSVREALDGLPQNAKVIHDTSGQYSEGTVTDEPALTVDTNPRLFVEGDVSGTAIEGEMARLRPGQKSDRYFSLIRASLSDPSPTVTQTGGRRSAASVVHPTERRKFTIAELRRICGFPDDFRLTGSYARQWERLGRAVPPPMMAAVARCAKEILAG